MAQEFGIFWGERLYQDLQPAKPVIKHILHEQDFCCINAIEGIGKSVLGQQLMHNLTMGHDFLDTFEISKPYNCLWIQAEGSRSKHIKRINDMRKQIPIDDKRWVHFNCANICFDRDEDFKKTLEIICKPAIDYDVMFFDSLPGLVDGDMNSNKTAKSWTRNVRAMAGEFNASIVVFNHPTKDQWMQGRKGGAIKVNKGTAEVFGSRQWGAFFTITYKLSVRDRVHYLQIGKDRDGDAIDEVPMKMIVPQYDSQGRLFYTQDDYDKDLCYTKIKGMLQDKKRLQASDMYNQKGENDHNKVSKASFYRVIRVIEGNKLAYKTEDEHGKVWFELI